MALHLPPKKRSEAQQFVEHLELALAVRFEIMGSGGSTPADVLKAVLDSVNDAKKAMNW